MAREIPFGYTLENDVVVAEPVNSEVIKWMFAAVEEYLQQPPKELVDAVIEEHEALHNETLTYEQAAPKVTYDAIVRYVTTEINIKMCVFKKTSVDRSVDELHKILTLSNEAAKELASKLPPDDEKKAEDSFVCKNITDVQRTIKPHFERTESIISKDLFEAVKAAKNKQK